jgi:hypothetical protein
MCGDCCKKTDTKKNVCSPECGAGANVTDKAIASIAVIAVGSSNAAVWVYWLTGVLFSLYGAYSLFGEDKFFSFWLLAAGAVMIFAGFWSKKISRKASNSKV